MPGLLHPRMLEHLYRFYATTVTVEAGTTSRTNSGQQDTTWAPVAELTDISASIAAVPAGERQQMEGTFSLVSHKIALRGHYPVITTLHRVTDADGQVWDIHDVQHDSQGLQTYLLVSRVAL